MCWRVSATGFESLAKARSFMKGRKQTALGMTWLSNVGFRLVECLFEFRMRIGKELVGRSHFGFHVLFGACIRHHHARCSLLHM